jgi:hypothetical protein
MVAWTFLNQVPTIHEIQQVDQATFLQVGFDQVIFLLLVILH